MALLAPERLSAPGDRQAIAELTAGYARPSEYYVDLLAQGMGRIAAAFSAGRVPARSPANWTVSR
jgi:pyruvate,water dikinase